VLSDTTIIGQRRAAQRIAAKANALVKVSCSLLSRDKKKNCGNKKGGEEREREKERKREREGRERKRRAKEREEKERRERGEKEAIRTRRRRPK